MEAKEMKGREMNAEHSGQFSNALANAFEQLTLRNRKFPGEALKTVLAHKEEALSVLREAVDKAIREGTDLDSDYELHFYALFLLGEFNDQESFPRVMKLVSLPPDTLDYLIGGAITDGLSDIAYHTYNGDLAFLKEAAMNPQADEFARAAMLEVMGQLYLDGRLAEGEWKDFIRQAVHSGNEYDYFFNGLAAVICQCHFVDMLPEIRYMLEQGLMDESVMGEYDSCVDEMFAYKEHQRSFCAPRLDTIGTLRHWAMFDASEDDETAYDGEEDDEEECGDEGYSLSGVDRKKTFEDLIRQEMNRMHPQAQSRKIGRNDPCPCGSGKKYKHCCLNKPKSPLDAIESPQDREKALEYYPYTGSERQEGRVYLEDYFDPESIEIDKILYLGLAHRIGFIWLKDPQKEEKRTREYLTLAFKRFAERAERDGIKSFAEYDAKYSIHYFCKDWMRRLLALLEENGSEEDFWAVREMMDRMG